MPRNVAYCAPAGWRRCEQTGLGGKTARSHLALRGRHKLHTSPACGEVGDLGLEPGEPGGG
jgi:hypothetical protein